MIGVYEQPPPAGTEGIIGYHRLDPETVDAYYWQSEAVELAKLLTRGKDFLHGLIP